MKCQGEMPNFGGEFNMVFIIHACIPCLKGPTTGEKSDFCLTHICRIRLAFAKDEFVTYTKALDDGDLCYEHFLSMWHFVFVKENKYSNLKG